MFLSFPFFHTLIDLHAHYLIGQKTDVFSKNKLSFISRTYYAHTIKMIAFSKPTEAPIEQFLSISYYWFHQIRRHTFWKYIHTQPQTNFRLKGEAGCLPLNLKLFCGGAWINLHPSFSMFVYSDSIEIQWLFLCLQHTSITGQLMAVSCSIADMIHEQFI